MNGNGGGAGVSVWRRPLRPPVWSPRGDLIAFTKINRGTFSIGVMQPDGKAERILAVVFWSRARPGHQTDGC